MGGRGASSATAAARRNSLVILGDPIELENDRHASNGNRWKFTILEATADGTAVTLSYATPVSYEHPNRNTTVARYALRSGIYTGQTSDRTTRSHNLDLSKATSVSGKTFDVRGYLKDQGFRWDRERERCVRAG